MKYSAYIKTTPDMGTVQDIRRLLKSDKRGLICLIPELYSLFWYIQSHLPFQFLYGMEIFTFALCISTCFYIKQTICIQYFILYTRNCKQTLMPTRKYSILWMKMDRKSLNLWKGLKMAPSCTGDLII